MGSGDSSITDREILVGILNAVTALAEKLSRERLTVYEQTSTGEVRWSRDTPAGGDHRADSRHNVAPTEDAVTWARLPRYQLDDSLER
jgi:hypothetical protein